MLLVRALDAAQRKSKGGIILPDAVKNGCERAEVLAVGPGLINEETGKRIAPDVEPGEIILVPLYAMQQGKEVEAGGEKLYLIPAPEVLADIEPEPSVTSISVSSSARIGVH